MSENEPPTATEPVDETEESEPETTPSGEAESTTSRVSRAGGRRPKTYLLWGAFALSIFLAVISAFSLYFQVGSVIGIWIAPKFQPIFRSGFDLAVLLLASYSALSFATLLGVRE